MLKIEVTKPSRNNLTGSALLRVIQNESMPWLDLLVRESIQNSLDAALEESEFVDVCYDVGNFNSEEFAGLLEGVSWKLKEHFPGKQDYIAIRDYQTEGLTGPLTHQEIKEGVDEGNLISLVYDIMKAQDQEGAGGSWGLGKTTYYRIGIGLVVYYSRIKNDDGNFEERLAINMVEDEEKSNYIPALKHYKRQGVAWWGVDDGYNKTKPMTDSKSIGKILNIFNIKPYKNDETGTTIIIPYINETQLLKSNLETEFSTSQNLPYWRRDIASYLDLSIQRWYAPRLNNKKYPHGPYLRAYIDGEIIKQEEMYRAFSILQDLYNYSLDENLKKFNHSFNYFREPINLQGVLKTREAGVVTFVKLSEDDLLQTPPNNNPNIFNLLGIRNTVEDYNLPIISYTRKPGMIVAFESDGPWVQGIDPLSPNEYVLACFTLNSNQMFKTEYIQNASLSTLEEYIREGEKADHNAWHDRSLSDFNIAIVERIQRNVSNKIASEFNEKEVVRSVSSNNYFSKKYGKNLLPNVGFGAQPTQPIKKSRNKTRKKTKPKSKNNKLEIDYEDIYYFENSLSIPFELSLNEKEEVEIVLRIVADGSSVEANNYEKDTEKRLPIEIKEITFEGVVGAKKIHASLNEESGYNSYEDFTCEFLETNLGSYYGMMILNKDDHKMSISGEILLEKQTDIIRPLISLR